MSDLSDVAQAVLWLPMSWHCSHWVVTMYWSQHHQKWVLWREAPMFCLNPYSLVECMARGKTSKYLLNEWKLIAMMEPCTLYLWAGGSDYLRGILEALTVDMVLKLRLRGWVCLGRQMGREFPGRGNNTCKWVVVWEGMVRVKKCRPMTCKEGWQELKWIVHAHRWVMMYP